ncbi:MAG: hypothetical protein EXS37_21885 [Opitutus sp.]|nr:hypothetical protein [Opitutus sp.]
MLSHREEVWLERLVDWNERRIADREPNEEEFKGIFGTDWKGWQKTMDDYVRAGCYQIVSIRVPPAVAGVEPVKLDLPVREMRELFVIAQVLNQNVPNSQAALDSLLARGLKSESLRELLFEACLRWRHPEQGLQLLREIVAGGTSNAAVFTELAQGLAGWSRFRPTLRRRIGPEATEIQELCRRALALDPLQPKANWLLAFAHAYGPNRGPENIRVIEETYRRIAGYMRTSDVVLDAGVAQWRAGNTAAATAIAQRILASPYADQRGKTIAAELMAAINAGVRPY